MADANKNFVAKVPTGIQNREELFKALQDILNLPDYFGHNWDALSECLHDLSWIAEKQVVLSHDDIPALKDKEIKEYLDILKTSEQYWAKTDHNRLRIVFP